MSTEETNCVQTCKGKCAALEIVSQQEKDAILEYAKFRDQCTYPEVRTILNDLIIRRQKSIQLLEEAKGRLKEKFGVIDQIREGFEMECS